MQIVNPPLEVLRVITPRLTVQPWRACFFRSKKLARRSSGVMWCSKLVNLSLLSRRAASRTPSNPRDLGTNGLASGFRRCVPSSSDCPAFSLVGPLPSPTPQAAARLPCSPVSSVLWNCLTPRRRARRTCGLAPSPTDPLPWRSGCRRGLSASVRKVSNRAGGLRLRGGDVELAMIVRHHCCLPLLKTRSATSKSCFRSSIHRPAVPL